MVEASAPFRLRNLRWNALLVSWIVDIGGSALFALAFLSWAIAAGLLPSTLLTDPEALSVALMSQAGLYAASFAGGLSFSIIAGYVAARLAGAHLLIYGLLSSVACLASDLASLDYLATLPPWVAAAGVVLAPVAGVFGGYVRVLELRRSRIPV